MNIMKSISHIIFDLDGTLSNSAIITYAAMQRVAPRFGLHTPTMDEIRRATGFANPEFYYILYPSVDRKKIYEMGQEVELEEQTILCDVKNLLFDGCHELLISLKDKGFTLYIASTGDPNHVFPILNETGITDLFEKVYCGQPDKFEMLRKIIGDNDKSSYAMVGDMKKDSEAARVNGILSIGACYGYCRKELGEFDMYVHSPQELFEFLTPAMS